MMLEEAPKETLLEVEDVQRESRHESVEAGPRPEARCQPNRMGPVRGSSGPLAAADPGRTPRRNDAFTRRG